MGSEDFTEQVERVAGGKEGKIVVYCANFDCDVSRKGAMKLENTGFTNVFDHAGRTRDWIEQKSAP